MKNKLQSQEGVVLPLFAMTSVIMLLIIFLILDIGKAHIVHSDAYKAADAASLAGASQADAHEIVDYEQHSYKKPVYRTVPVHNQMCGYFDGDDWECKRVPPYTKKVFDHWEYDKEPPIRTIVDKWAEIRRDDAKEVASQIYRANAYSSSLIENLRENGGELYFNSYLTEPDQMAAEVHLDMKYDYFPSFSEGLFNEDVPEGVRVREESESWSKVVEW